jgi:hypothetical protein
MNIRDEWTRLAAERLQAETDRWCWKALAQGVGNRVWRSNPIAEPWPSTVTTYEFAILKPGEPAPGSGWVFGPFSGQSSA